VKRGRRKEKERAVHHEEITGTSVEKRLGTSLREISSSLEEKKKQRDGKKFNYTATVNTSSYALHALSTYMMYTHVYIMYPSCMWDAPTCSRRVRRTPPAACPLFPLFPLPPTPAGAGSLTWIVDSPDAVGEPCVLGYDDGTGRRTDRHHSRVGDLECLPLRTARSIPDGTVLAPYSTDAKSFVPSSDAFDQPSQRPARLIAGRRAGSTCVVCVACVACVVRPSIIVRLIDSVSSFPGSPIAP
jgi:hypothetical protein